MPQVSGDADTFGQDTATASYKVINLRQIV